MTSNDGIGIRQVVQKFFAIVQPKGKRALPRGNARFDKSMLQRVL
jgi:hypothetical protein